MNELFETLIYFPNESLFAFGKIDSLELNEFESLSKADGFIDQHNGKYVFSCISYDVKNSIEKLTSSNSDFISFPYAIFWTAKLVLTIVDDQFVIIEGGGNDIDFDEVEVFVSAFMKEQEASLAVQNLQFHPSISKEFYLTKIDQAKEQIQLGNVYELNFCQQFVATNVKEINSSLLFHRLHKMTEAPFSVYVKWMNWEVFCGSPERFIQRKGSKMITQPIKGTIQRGKTALEDEQFINQLSNNPKEISENMMITDLVRNDLSKIALRGSVCVEELIGVHTFKTLHHLISTVACELNEEVTFSTIFEAMFPMGSMTGAPKLSVMKITEELESFKRGIYSGTIGCIHPSGDFDFNVVIRSLVYNQTLRTLSCAVGSAITIESDPKSEYNECLTKVKRIIELFGEQKLF
jgi:para-aminobenzoate synthetase component 1